MSTRSSEAKIRVAVETLSLPGKQALLQVKSKSHGPDEIALRFDEAYTAFVTSWSQLPTDAQMLALQSIDSELSAMSGSENQSLWTDAAFIADPRWEAVRQLALSALRAFGW